MKIIKKMACIAVCLYGTICAKPASGNQDAKNYAFAQAVDEFSQQADVFVERIKSTVQTSKQQNLKKQKTTSVVLNETCTHCKNLCQLEQAKA